MLEFKKFAFQSRVAVDTKCKKERENAMEDLVCNLISDMLTTVILQFCF